MYKNNPRTVVITGASAGVGRATAIAFASKGWNVGLIARGKQGLEGARRDVEAAGGGALVLPLDVADPEAVFAAADQVVEQWGRIDVWINDAMATIFAPVEDITPEEFKRVTEVTYLGQVYGTMAALKHMREREPRHDRASGIRAELSGYSPPVGLLWCEVCHPGLYRCLAERAQA